MLFTSSIFLYGFLPIVLGTFFLLGKFIKEPASLLISFLILASFIFYGFYNPENAVLLSFSIAVNFGVAKLIEKRKHPAALLTIGVIFNLALLGYFKYTNFFLENISYLTHKDFDALDIALPLAISFYTFQQIAYLADVKSQKVKDVSFKHYLLFVTFFPQLIIGPIVHHSEMIPQFISKYFGKIRWEDFVIGALYLFSGIIKKLFIADPLGTYVDLTHSASAAGDPVSFGVAWVTAFAFSMQIYFDFSGYTDMAIGLARFFGIQLPINFNSPYKSINFVEFWRRWHMTLSRWLRDYLYIPLGGNQHGFARLALCAFIVFILGGLWHGAAWTFVLWGLFHGLGVTMSHGINKTNLSFPALPAIAVTFLLVTLSWVLFRAENLDSALLLYQTMFTLPDNFALNINSVPYAVLGIALLIVFALPNTHTVIPKLYDISVKMPRVSIFIIIIISWLSLATFDLDSSAEFIYFDF